LAIFDLADIQGLEARLLSTPVAMRKTWGGGSSVALIHCGQSTPSLTRGRQLSLERCTNAIAPAFIAAIGADKGAYT
jgi:hypothetical protein